MCGIVGYINLDNSKSDYNVIKRMTDVIFHRGPDGEGHWIEDNIAIGHRRLSIIDLSTAGNQPMVSKDSRYILSYNGELYNFKELRCELETEGYFFNSNSDTEVVLNSYIHWGDEALIKFNGMFAFAVWDRIENSLFMARDRYGIKPIYYVLQENFFCFGSEQKSFPANPLFKVELNKPAVFEYFTFQNIFTEQTFYKNVSLLQPGHFAYFYPKEKNLKVKRYWDYRFREPEFKINKFEYYEELDRLFKQAVSRQLVSDVELGTYLSGGMDSGSITAIASQKFNNLKSFTCGFDLSSASGIELGFDERVKAEAMSAKFRTEHYEMVLKAGDMERCLKKLSWHLEEPRVGQSYPNFYAAKLASKFVKVVLSGSGGDELFGGYPWRYYRAAGSQNFEHFIDQYYLYWQRLLSNSQLKQVFRPIWNEINHIWTRDIFRDVFKSHDNDLNTPEDYINHSLYFEAKTFLHGLFIVEDKISMAHSLESRVPFMDNDLVDFAMNCPIHLKLNNLNNIIKINENEPGIKQNIYFEKTNDGKQILREVMSRYIPEEISYAVKQGFSSPDSSWFKGESIDFVRKSLLNKNAKIYELMDRNAIESLINEHLNGVQNRRLLIWSLLNFESILIESF